MACDRFVRTIEDGVAVICGVYVDSPLAWAEPDGYYVGGRCQGAPEGVHGLCGPHDAALRSMLDGDLERAAA